MASVFFVLLSVKKMKDMVNYRDRSTMLRLFTGPYDDMLLIVKFLKSYSNFKEPKQKNKYLMISFIFWFGILVFFGTIVFCLQNL
jgi:hypothetical protein